MIQDIFPHKLYNQYDRRTEIREGDTVFYFEGTKLLVKNTAHGIDFPKAEDFGMDEEYTYLLTMDDQKYFLLKNLKEIPAGCEYSDVFILRRTSPMPREQIYTAWTAKHLADWYRDNQFCGRCGKPMAHSTKERAMTCTCCGYTAYPRIMPAVIVGVKNGNKLLLTKYRNGNGNNALIAGFTEIGETLEETVQREVMEEAGVRVKNIRYYKSQPWGVANDILSGFYCELDGDEEIHMDSQELKIAHWVERQDIELQPDDFSLTNEMMMMFKEGKQ